MSLPGLSPDDERLRDWLLHTVDRDGYAAVEVAGDADGAPYAFTAGVWRRFGAPEGVVIGLPVELARPLLDLYVRRTMDGERFYPGLPYLDFFDGVPVVVERVHKGHYPERFGSAFLLYPQGDFPALQLIVATPQGKWPWSADAPDGFADWQPVLTYSGGPETWRPGIDGP